jgi:hypothetical protein
MSLDEVQVPDGVGRCLVRRWLLPSEDVPVRVARYLGDTRQFGEHLESFDWSRPEALRIGEHCFESDRVAMDVSDDPQPHDRQRIARVHRRTVPDRLIHV